MPHPTFHLTDAPMRARSCDRPAASAGWPQAQDRRSAATRGVGRPRGGVSPKGSDSVRRVAAPPRASIRAMEQIEAWSEFNVAMVGATAALAGLVIVAASVNIAEIIKEASLTARLAAGIAGLV